MHPSVVKASLEVSSVGAIVSYWVGYLPSFLGITATTLSIAWYIYCFYKEFKRKNNN